MATECAVLFVEDYGGPTDDQGCHLPVGHAGPHEFVAKSGMTYQWETDLECDCEHCRSADGDYCVIYWEVKA